LVKACIGLAVPGRPIRSLPRRTGAPKASATGRDRSPSVHGGYTRSRQVAQCDGYERSLGELRNGRSDRQRGREQVARHEAGESSSLPAQEVTVQEAILAKVWEEAGGQVFTTDQGESCATTRTARCGPRCARWPGSCTSGTGAWSSPDCAAVVAAKPSEAGSWAEESATGSPPNKGNSSPTRPSGKSSAAYIGYDTFACERTSVLTAR
jgi:hypothetical protein